MMRRRRLRSRGRSAPGEKAFEALDTNKGGAVTEDEISKGTDISKDKVTLHTYIRYINHIHIYIIAKNISGIVEYAKCG